MDGLILYIMFAHWLADFVCQTSWMANNKSKNVFALFSHAAVYTGVLLYMLLMLAVHIDQQECIECILKFGLLNGFAHFCIDGVTAPINKYLWSKNWTHKFFCMIGFDQFIHFVFLYVTMKMYL